MPDNKLINWLIGIAVIEGVVLETHRLFSEARSTKAAMKDLHQTAFQTLQADSS